MREESDMNGSENLDKRELKDARRRSSPKVAIVYEAIRHEGEEELGRSFSALVWSGLAAGLSIFITIRCFDKVCDHPQRFTCRERARHATAN